MGIISKLITTAIDEFLKPVSFKKGEAFEEYLRDRIFPEELYTLFHQTHGYEQNDKRFVESSLLPDLGFYPVRTKKKFYVEAKYRSSFVGDKLEWAKDYQLKRYREIDRDTPVFIAIGLGGEPKHPDKLFLIPVSHIKYTGLFGSFLKPYELSGKKAVEQETLWKLRTSQGK